MSQFSGALQHTVVYHIRYSVVVQICSDFVINLLLNDYISSDVSHNRSSQGGHG